MAAALNQDFVTYAGNAVSPIFTVQTTAGVAINISTVSDITWQAQPDADTAAVLTKKKSNSGQIVFVTDGTDGKFQVNIATGDTTNFSGYYIHSATIFDASSNPTTVAVGRMQVALKPTWTYNPVALATSALFQVRRLIGDVLQADMQMQDQEILWQITQYPNIYSAAAACARALSAQYARLVDTIQGEMRTLYGQKAKNYQAIAAALEAQGRGRSGALAFAGGISASDKETQVEDNDRVSPQFNLMMNDNLLPEAPVGNLTPASRAAATGP